MCVLKRDHFLPHCVNTGGFTWDIPRYHYVLSSLHPWDAIKWTLAELHLGSSSFRVLFTCVPAHCHTVLTDRDVCSTEPSLTSLLTPVLSLLWQDEASAAQRAWWVELCWELHEVVKLSQNMKHLRACTTAGWYIDRDNTRLCCL